MVLAADLTLLCIFKIEEEGSFDGFLWLWYKKTIRQIT
jgi:hypothetical protein